MPAGDPVTHLKHMHHCPCYPMQLGPTWGDVLGILAAFALAWVALYLLSAVITRSWPQLFD